MYDFLSIKYGKFKNIIIIQSELLFKNDIKPNVF